jgi:RNA polymerase sigma-70 factor (ECF subfamily)
MAESAVPDDLESLLGRVQAGDDAALAELLQRYEVRLRTAARVLLGPLLRPHLDSLDLVQSVHRVLLPGLRAGQYELTDPEQLVSLAVTVLRRKVADSWRKLQTHQKWAAQSSEAALATQRPDDDPARLAQFRDSLEKLFAQVNEADRRLLELYLVGWGSADIGAKVGYSDHVVRARLSKLRLKLAELGGPDWF